MNLRGIVALIVLLGAAASSWWLIRSTDRVRTDNRAGQQDLPGYYLKDARILGTAEDGSLLYRIEAVAIRQAPARDSVHLEGVRVSYAQPGQAGWTVSAREGNIEGRGERIDLRGAVELVNNDAPVGKELIIRTETLSFQPREQFASTAEAVNISQKGYVLTAVGMEADLNQQLLRLKSDVSGTFQP